MICSSVNLLLRIVCLHYDRLSIQMRDHLGLRSLGKGALSLVHAQGEAASAEPALWLCCAAA
jgi:hypothetical protein